MFWFQHRISLLQIVFHFIFVTMVWYGMYMIRNVLIEGMSIYRCNPYHARLHVVSIMVDLILLVVQLKGGMEVISISY